MVTELSQRAHMHKPFAFGKNWSSYAKLVGPEELAQAKAGLIKLVPEDEWRGRTVLDIGCGSGLQSVTFAELDVASIKAIDVDPDSVATTRALLERFGISADVECRSVFDLPPGQFDIVHSWGVLHHTGDMWRAIDCAAAMVRPGGLFVFALYRSTKLDSFWTREKRWYAHASKRTQSAVRRLYRLAYRVNHIVKGVDHDRFVREYRSLRGMDFEHDIHDWLGGFPYETALAPEVDARMKALGFSAERVFALPMTRGILGSGCDEYVYRRA